jgi:hypothetical protein
VWRRSTQRHHDDGPLHTLDDGVFPAPSETGAADRSVTGRLDGAVSALRMCVCVFCFVLLCVCVCAHRSVAGYLMAQ